MLDKFSVLFIAETLFFKTIIRIYRWSQDFGGNEAQISSHGARFYLDSEHDFVILMAPKHLARFKVRRFTFSTLSIVQTLGVNPFATGTRICSNFGC